MHYSLEIILPAMPIEHVEKAVAELMAPFDENNDSPKGYNEGVGVLARRICGIITKAHPFG